LIGTSTVLVAVQSPGVREGLVALLGAREGFQVIGEAATSEQALALARDLRPRLVLIDQDLCGPDGGGTIRALCSERLAEVVVALGRRANGELAQLAGAQAYVQIGTTPRELLSALEAAIRA
jgi:DNA-binding NarL/FixJ family response regulator